MNCKQCSYMQYLMIFAKRRCTVQVFHMIEDSSHYGLSIDMRINWPSSSNSTSNSSSTSFIITTQTSLSNSRAGPIYPLTQLNYSTLVAHILASQPGNIILDLYAAPCWKDDSFCVCWRGIIMTRKRQSLGQSRKKVVAIRGMVVSRKGGGSIFTVCMDSTQYVIV